MEDTSLIVNESYWNLESGNPLKKQSFLIENSLNFNNPLSKINSSFAAIMKKKDSKNNVIYGIEIKTNGSSRSARIPLVRISDNNHSIWKIAKTVKGLEKSMIVLNDLVYHLEKSKDNRNLPRKVLLLLEREKQYINNKNYCDFIRSKVEENKVILISTDFLLKLIKEDFVDFDTLLKEKTAIFTTEPLK